jgi:hypothetical protein
MRIILDENVDRIVRRYGMIYRGEGRMDKGGI